MTACSSVSPAFAIPRQRRRRRQAGGNWRWRKSRSPGWQPKAAISCRWSARAAASLTEALSLDVKLTPAHLADLAKAFPPGVAAGTRYAEEQMAHLDSEKRKRA
jgi:hypothetical protein